MHDSWSSKSFYFRLYLLDWSFDKFILAASLDTLNTVIQEPAFLRFFSIPIAILVHSLISRTLVFFWLVTWFMFKDATLGTHSHFAQLTFTTFPSRVSLQPNRTIVRLLLPIQVLQCCIVSRWFVSFFILFAIWICVHSSSSFTWWSLQENTFLFFSFFFTRLSFTGKCLSINLTTLSIITFYTLPFFASSVSSNRSLPQSIHSNCFDKFLSFILHIIFQLFLHIESYFMGNYAISYGRSFDCFPSFTLNSRCVVTFLNLFNCL